MKRVVLSFALLGATLAQATTVSIQSNTIDTNEPVTITATDLPGHDRDWVAIYPAGAQKTFANIITYQFTHGKHAGDFDMGTVPAGKYEADSFDAGSWRPSSTFLFTVTGQAQKPTISMDKDQFEAAEHVTVHFDNMPGDNHDWVAIFPKGAANTFANIVSYQFTHGATSGNIDFGHIATGDYEARVFKAHSWRASSTHPFTVTGEAISPTITTDKNAYLSNEIVKVSIGNMPSNDRDWVAIFPKGARSTFANIVVYRYTHTLRQGDITIGTLPAGDYEARAFYANSWRAKASSSFSVFAVSPYDNDAIRTALEKQLQQENQNLPVEERPHVDPTNFMITYDRKYLVAGIDGQPFYTLNLYDISDIHKPTKVDEIFSFYLAGIVAHSLTFGAGAQANDIVKFVRFDNQNREFSVEYSISQKRIINEQRL